MTSENLNVMCCFCGHSLSYNEAVQISAYMAINIEEVQGLCAHLSCFDRTLHESIPRLFDNPTMEISNTNLDKVLNYIGERIDFQSNDYFEHEQNDMTNMLIDLQVSFEMLKKILGLFEKGGYIKDLVIDEEGFSFLRWNNLYEIWDEGGFVARENSGQ